MLVRYSVLNSRTYLRSRRSSPSFASQAATTSCHQAATRLTADAPSSPRYPPCSFAKAPKTYSTPRLTANPTPAATCSSNSQASETLYFQIPTKAPACSTTPPTKIAIATSSNNNNLIKQRLRKGGKLLIIRNLNRNRRIRVG